MTSMDNIPDTYQVKIELVTTEDVTEFTNLCKSIEADVFIKGKDEYGTEFTLNAKSFMGNLAMTALVKSRETIKKEKTAHSIDWNTIYVESEADIYNTIKKFAR